ncbi:hypothetical protein P154DRAFT_525404 [Amniculicola lignicola CBS 123094]|uniref:F-box domain-containing protein n=1 Tax=Amniculicola lignicola CBS 123094 TaxID=1392246 RepID=A0A6A5WGC8_9PLEO|nr:hypothetical protein P154DRAFT_525404 [Amniculicola lignicola CBS 123094]
MSSILEVLPTELLLQVLTYLRTADLAGLLPVSKRFKKIIEPMVWSKIELHRPCFHEDYALLQLQPLEEAVQRPYQHYRIRDVMMSVRFDDQDSMKQDFDEKTSLFFRNFEAWYIAEDEKKKTRAEELARLVKWLCLPVNGPWGLDPAFEFTPADESKKSDPWNALAKMRNLEYLEISADWETYERAMPFNKDAAPKMTRLKTVKLRGHLPKAFVRHVLRNGEGITELQLGILDKPLESALDEVQEKSSSESDCEGEYQDEGEEEDDESIYDETMAPRGLACLTPDMILSFTSLTCLYLMRPAEGNEGIAREYYSVSGPAERHVLREWAYLLRATRRTLTHLILDHRVIGDENAPDGTDNDTYMVFYCHGPGYYRFVNIVLPVLLEDEWPNLQSVKLFGIDLDGIDKSEYELLDGGGEDVTQQLKRRFPTVKIESALGRRMLFESGSGTVETGGDVLDCVNGFTPEEEEQWEKRRVEGRLML